MTPKLFCEAMAKFFFGVLLVALLIFLPAGTTSYFFAWLLMGIMFIPMFFAGLVMMFKNPVLLQSRLEAKEKHLEQDRIVKCIGLMFLAGFVVAGLGVRFNWYRLPNFVSLVGVFFFLLSYLLYAGVLFQNKYLSRTIKAQENQKVIETGLYRVVRHPMYSATLILFLSIPIVLGSLYAFFIFLAYPFLIAKRILHEEKFLEENLDGYRAYKQKTKYRLIPLFW